MVGIRPETPYVAHSGTANEVPPAAHSAFVSAGAKTTARATRDQRSLSVCLRKQVNQDRGNVPGTVPAHAQEYGLRSRDDDERLPQYGRHAAWRTGMERRCYR